MAAVKYLGGFIRGTRAERFSYTTTNLNAGWIFIESDTLDEYYWNGTKWNLKTLGCIRKIGEYAAGASGLTNGILAAPTSQGAASFQQSFTSPAGKALRWTTAGVSGDNAGLLWSSAFVTYRGWYPRLFSRFRIDTITSQRTWIGWTNNTGAHPTGDTELNSRTGILVGRRSTDNSNWIIMYNDGTATALYTAIGSTPDALVHTVEIIVNDAVPAFYVSLDNAAFVTISGSQIPAQNTAMTPCIEIEDSAGAVKILDIHLLQVQSDL